MRKVTTVNLNGNAYQLEEGAFDRLKQYLDAAEAALRTNPDREEVLADLERAIGDKCDTWLGAHKNVVSEREMEQILREMGTVEGADEAVSASEPGIGPGSATGAAAAGGGPRRRRLYRVPTEGMLGGVCAGLAAYFSVDVVWVRLGFVLLTLATGVWLLVWFAMLWVMPPATTPEEIADAHGEPLSAREVIERAKKKSAEFAGSASGHAHGNWQRFGEDMKSAGVRLGSGMEDAVGNAREFSHRLRERARRRREFRRRRRLPPTPVSPGARLAAALSLPFLSIVSAALFVVFVYVVVSLLMSGQVFGYAPLWFLPPWVAVAIVVLLYLAIGGPIGVARRMSQRHANGGHSFGWASSTDGLFWVVLVVLFFYLGFHYLPELRDWLQQVVPTTRAISV